MANPLLFINQVRSEVNKISWPTRREVSTTTIMVLVFAALTTTLFFGVDLIIRTVLIQGLSLIGG